MTHPEPRFAKVASTIADPTRARMLAALMGGEFMSAGELAAAAGITAQTASAHLAKLLQAEMVVLRSQGRHRYFRLAGEEIAQLLEALSFVAERNTHAEKWERGAYKPLKFARTCYRHIAGELGVAIFQGLLSRGAIVARDGHCELTDAGRADFTELGIDLTGQASEGRRFARTCFDWSERRDHLAGGLATMLLDHGLGHDWLRRCKNSRVLALTPTGRQALGRWIEGYGV